MLILSRVYWSVNRFELGSTKLKVVRGTLPTGARREVIYREDTEQSK